jgi:CRISPR-associated protein Cmr3
MSKTYLITLTPTGKFFFGGDMTFTVNDEETQFTSYIIRSNKFPQQTSLLGMLRFLILRNDEIAFDAEKQSFINRDAARALIGEESFRMGKTDGYGKIKKIHPCFLQKDGVPIRFLERDYKFEVQFDKQQGNNNKTGLFDIPEIKGYDAKDGIASLYLIDGVEVPESDIFVEDWRMGINRDIKTGRVDDNSLYKQVCYRLNDKLFEYERPLYDKDREHKKDPTGNELYKLCKYTFAFYAEMDLTPEEEAKYQNQLVSVGGDNSQFIIDIKQKDIPNEEKTGTTVVLLSPAYLDKEDLKDVCFAISETIPFKCMKTETTTVEAYNRRNHRYDYIEGLNLYDRGSVFYFKTPTGAKTFTEMLELTHADFYQIGYNHYMVK